MTKTKQPSTFVDDPTQTVVFAPRAHDELLKGANILADAVASTMGPSGHSVIIDMETGPPQITKDGVTVARSIKLRDRLQSMGAELLKEIAGKTNEIAGDGPQPTYAKVLTPKGWTNLGSLRVGDAICGTNGTVQSVLGVYNKGIKDIYKVTFSDGNTDSRFVECSEEHLWSVTTLRGCKKTLTTKQLLENGVERSGHGGGKYFIKPTVVEFASNTEIPIDPYLLGVLLGDGSLSFMHDVEIAVGLHQEHMLDNLILPTGTKLRKQFYRDNKHYIKATITGSERKNRKPVGLKSVIKTHLTDLGLLGTNSRNKFIPKQYLFSSIDTRNRLLQGLIDTDGYVNKKGLFEYSTASDQLCRDFIELCKSLGKSVYHKAYHRKENDGSFGTGIIHRICELKGNRYGLRLKGIEKLGEKTEMMCIKVSNSDHLYITNDYVPTHNTTTATVLGRAMLSEGIKMISTNRSSIGLKKGMDIGTAEVLEFLKQRKIPVSSVEDIVNVGTISANGDRSIGELIATAIQKVGKDGIITIEPAKSVQTTLEVVEGMQVDGGYVSPFFVTNSEKATCELDNPYVLLTPNKVSSIQDIIKILEGVAKNNRSLLIIADDVEGDALHTLIVNKTKGILKVCAIKAPSYGEHRADILSDIQTLVGGVVFGATTDLSIKNAGVDSLGTAKKVIVGRGGATIIGSGGEDKKAAVEQRVANLRTLLEQGTLDALHTDKTRKRLAKLSGGIAVIKVGGSTEVEILEKKDRVEDAVNATMAATQEGIVPGGGTALFYAALDLRHKIKEAVLTFGLGQDEVSGIEMIANVCEAPLRTIVGNTGVSPDIVIEKLVQSHGDHKVFYIDVGNVAPEDLISYIESVKSKMKKQSIATDGTILDENDRRFRHGYNAALGKYDDLVAQGIIDPVKVTRCALEHASSVVGLVLTCNSVVVNEVE